MSGLSMQRTETRCVALPGTPVITGRLDDPAWSGCTAYPLAGMVGAGGVRAGLAEAGSARFLWDDEAFYLGADFIDADVVTEADADGLHAYLLGDVCELFLRPSGARHYGEFHVTPNGHQTSFLWPSGGRRLPQALQKDALLRVAATVQGRLNDEFTTDRGWRAEMAIPWSVFRRGGVVYGPGDEWDVLVGRYNYGVTLPAVELSSMPEISVVDFHRVDEYARLRLEPAR